MLQLLSNGERSVTELAGSFAASRSAISQHLLLLSEVGLVTARKEGRNRYYALDNRGIEQLRRLFESFWTNELNLLAEDARRLQAQSNHAQTPQGEL